MLAQFAVRAKQQGARASRKEGRRQESDGRSECREAPISGVLATRASLLLRRRRLTRLRFAVGLSLVEPHFFRLAALEELRDPLRRRDELGLASVCRHRRGRRCASSRSIALRSGSGTSFASSFPSAFSSNWAKSCRACFGVFQLFERHRLLFESVERSPCDFLSFASSVSTSIFNRSTYRPATADIAPPPRLNSCRSSAPLLFRSIRSNMRVGRRLQFLRHLILLDPRVAIRVHRQQQVANGVRLRQGRRLLFLHRLFWPRRHERRQELFPRKRLDRDPRPPRRNNRSKSDRFSAETSSAAIERRRDSRPAGRTSAASPAEADSLAAFAARAAIAAHHNQRRPPANAAAFWN